MIHSKSTKPDEIFKFTKIFKNKKYAKPLISVPSTYSKTYEKELRLNGFQIIIYANHQIRASYKSMMNTAQTILKNQRAFETEKSISKINEVLTLIK